MSDTPDTQLHESEVRKNDAEASKFEAEERHLDAQSRRAEAETREKAAEAAIAERDAEVSEFRLEREREKRNRERSDFRQRRIYNFTDRVSADSTTKCIKELNYWHVSDPGCDVEIVFDSPGGSVFDGLNLFDFIQELRRDGHHVTTHTRGMAASMAGILLQAGDKRTMSAECQPPDATVLTPDLRSVRHGDLSVGDQVLAFDELSALGRGHRKWQVATVLAADRAVRDCFEIFLDDGSTHVVTGAHRLLRFDGGGWMTPERLNKKLGNGPSRLHRAMPTLALDQSRDAGWMSGILDGEGCFHHSQKNGTNLRVVQAAGPTLERIRNWLAAYEYKTYERTIAATDRHKEQTSIHVCGGLSEVARLLAQTRPRRLIPSFGDALTGRRFQKLSSPAVEWVRPIGRHEVVRLQTDTGTYVGDGLAQHNSWLLIHEISTVIGGKIGELEDEVALVHKIQERVLDIFAARSSLSKITLRRKWRRRDWWIDSDEALKLGLVDEVR